MGVVDGQAVSAAVTNPAFINKNQDDVMPGILGLANTDLASGATIDNTQRVQNRLMDATGVAENPDADNGMDYSATAPNERVSDGENHEISIAKLDSAFNDTTGHKHTGAAGDAPPIESEEIANPPIYEFAEEGSDYTTAAAPSTSTDVSAYLVGKTPSTGPTVSGVVVTAPENRVIIRQSAAAPHENEPYTDSSGNIVYGRLTEAALVWTLSYYTLVGNVETAFSFPASSRIRWYYNEIFNPLSQSSPPPVYSPFFKLLDDSKSSSSGSSGGGAGLVWNQSGGNSPTEDIFANEQVFNFEPLSGQTIYSAIKVPDGYVAGDPITLALAAFSPSTANDFLLTTVATLIQEGVDAIDSVTNQHTSTNTAVTNTAPANLYHEVLCDLTDGTGMINGVAVTPGDVIRIALSRSAVDTDTADVSMMPVGTEIRFS